MGSPPPGAVIGGVRAVSIGAILRDATAEDECDDELEAAEKALETLKLGDPDAAEG